MSLKIGQYLMKLSRTKKRASFLGHPVRVTMEMSSSSNKAQVKYDKKRFSNPDCR